MTSPTLGVQDLINLAAALADTADVIDTVTASGVPTWAQLPQLFKAVNVLKEFGTVNFKEVLPEYNDMTDAEVSQVVGAFNGHLNIKEATMQGVIEAGFQIILEAATAIQALKAVLASITGKGAAKPAA